MAKGDFNNLKIEIKGKKNINISKVTKLINALGYSNVTYYEHDNDYYYDIDTSDEMDNYVEIDDIDIFAVRLFEMMFETDIEVFYSYGNLSSGEICDSYMHEAGDLYYYMILGEEDFVSDLKSLYIENEGCVERIKLQNVKVQKSKKKDVKSNNSMHIYKSTIREGYLYNIGGLSTHELLNEGDGRCSVELNLDGKFEKSIVNEEFIVTNYWGNKTLFIENFTVRKVTRKKIVLYYMEWDEWDEEHSKLLINKCLVTYLQEKGITNFFDIIETKKNTKDKKPIDFVDFFRWLAPRIKHEIRTKNIKYNDNSKYKFSAPYKDNI